MPQPQPYAPTKFVCWTCNKARVVGGKDSTLERCCLDCLTEIHERIDDFLLSQDRGPRQQALASARLLRLGKRLADRWILSDDDGLRRAAIAWRNFAAIFAGV